MFNIEIVQLLLFVAKSIRLQLRTYIFLTQKWTDLKCCASNNKTCTNEIMWLGCSKKSDTTTALEVKMQCLSFCILSHIKNINASQGPQYTNLLQRIFLVTRQTARMQFLCVNPSRGKDHHCAYEKCENHL